MGVVIMSEEMGKRLKYLRDKCGYKQNFIAEKIGVKNNTLSGYESGYRTPDPETLSKLADIYNVSTDYLINGTEQNNMYNVPNDFNVMALREITKKYDVDLTNEEDKERLEKIISAFWKRKHHTHD